MPNAAGYRANWAVVIPSTSTTVEHDFALMRPHGITFHAGRSMIHRPDMRTDEAAISVLDQMDQSRDEAIRQVMTANPDHLIVAMSAEIIRNGAAGAKAFIEDLEQRYEIGVTTGPTACAAALAEMGHSRIGVLTPYQPVSDRRVVEFFDEIGVEVRRIHGLRCASATAIADVTPQQITAALRDLDGDDVDALVQVGTNLSVVAAAAAAELWLGKPVIAMNSATLWHALRTNGFPDSFQDFGVLLREY